jgi:LysM repeat protein
MAARSPARYLAPIALVVTVAGAYLIVQNGTSDHRSAAAGQHPSSGGRGTAARNRPQPAKYYLVQSGDNLSAIAAKTHTPLATLEGLNPLLDPNSLQTGQRIRLRQ